MNSLIDIGKRKLANSSIIICGIVRDCEKNLKNNITVIEKLRSFAKESHVVIFENDSKDKTKEILAEWTNSCSNVHILSETYNETTLPDLKGTKSNRFFCEYRIKKMSFFRNKYFDYIEANHLNSDYTIIVDLDVAQIFIDGIFDSLGWDGNWDVMTSNCYSTSPFLIRKYHDGYALTKWGEENLPQTVWSIKFARYKWRYLTIKKRFMPVYSAFGGLAIYKTPVLKNLRYKVIPNNDQKVEVRCEHYSLAKQIHERKDGRIFMNKQMKLKYQNITWSLILHKLSLLIRFHIE